MPRASFRSRTIATFVCLLSAGAALTAPDSIDTEVMQALDDHNKDLASDLAKQDRDAATANAAEVHRLLQQIEAYYAAKGDAPDALTFSRQGVQLALRVRQQVDGAQFPAAAATAIDLSRNCKSCHNVYKLPK